MSDLINKIRKEKIVEYEKLIDSLETIRDLLSVTINRYNDKRFQIKNLK